MFLGSRVNYSGKDGKAEPGLREGTECLSYKLKGVKDIRER